MWKFVRRYKRRINSLRKRIPYRQTVTYLRKNPFRSFFVVLGILFALIVLGNIIASLTKKGAKEPEVVKDIEIYEVSKTPKLRLQAKIDASGVVQIHAQTAGVVQSINASEGEHVDAGTPIVYLSTTYQGGNAAALQQQLAAKQYQNVLDTFDTQKDLIRKQRELAEKNKQNAGDLTAITKTSQGDVQELLRLEESQLTQIKNTIATLEATNVNGINDELIAQAQQQEAQLLQAVIQLRAQLRSVDYQTDPDKPPASLPDIQKDVALQQLDIQEKALDLSRDVSVIQVQLAAVQAQLMIPASPFEGTVEKIHVSVGQSVSPGTLIATVTGTENTVSASVLMPRRLATVVSQVEKSTIEINGNFRSVLPSYVSQGPTDGKLYTILYNLPEGSVSEVSNGEFVPIEVPVGIGGNKSALPYIPIDSVYQTQEEAYVNVASSGKAISKKVLLGDVYGRYVQIISGLKRGDKVIMNRNIIAGEKVKLSGGSR